MTDYETPRPTRFENDGEVVDFDYWPGPCRRLAITIDGRLFLFDRFDGDVAVFCSVGRPF